MPHGDGMHLPKASLISEDALPARDVVSGQVVMLDGQLVSTDREPADPGQLRLTLVPGVRPPHGSSPDRREIFLVCPHETIMATVTRMTGWPVDKARALYIRLVAGRSARRARACALCPTKHGVRDNPRARMTSEGLRRRAEPILSPVAFAQSGPSDRHGPSGSHGSPHRSTARHCRGSHCKAVVTPG